MVTRRSRTITTTATPTPDRVVVHPGRRGHRHPRSAQPGRWGRLPRPGAHIDPTVAAVSVGIALLGVLVSWALSRRPGGDPATVLSESWARATQVNLGTDRLYAGFAAGVVALARVVVRLDNAVVDALPRGLASGATATGGAADRAHRGVPSTGLLAVLSGGLIVPRPGVALWR